MAASLPPLSARHLAELAGELAPLVRGARIREVDSLPPRDLLLVLEPQEPAATGRDPGGEASPDRRIRRLRLSADAAHARLHLQLGGVRRHRGPAGPFFRAAKAALAGARLVALEALPGERIVRLDVSRSGAAASLVLEAIGRHANLLLLDGEGRIAHVLVPPRPDSPVAPRLAPGATYAPPRGGTAPPAEPLARVLPDPPAPRPELAPLALACPGSWRVEASLGRAAERTLADELRRDLARRARRRLKGARKKRTALERQEHEAAGAERLQHDAELLVAGQAAIPRGARSVELVDYFAEGAPPRTIELDPRQSAGENARRLFARARKLARAAERLPGELALAREHERALEELLAETEDPAVDPFALEERAVADGRVTTRPLPRTPHTKKRPPRRLPYRSFRACHGGEIRVGRSARDNDELTFRASRGNDVWLHTRDAPGSHVVLRVEKGHEPDSEELLDAAHLAVHFSPLSGTRRADVHVARCKEVKKPSRAPAGLVTL